MSSGRHRPAGSTEMDRGRSPVAHGPPLVTSAIFGPDLSCVTLPAPALVSQFSVKPLPGCPRASTSAMAAQAGPYRCPPRGPPGDLDANEDSWFTMV